MTSRFTEEIVVDALNKLFRSEVFVCVLCGLLIVITVIISIFVYKTSTVVSRFNSLLLLIFVGACSVGLIILRIIHFVPIYTDCKHVSYTIEENVQIFIIEGTTSIWEQTNEVIVTNQEGKTIKLKITNDYKYDTNTKYVGTIAYANNSKYILWYNLQSE